MQGLHRSAIARIVVALLFLTTSVLSLKAAGYGISNGPGLEAVTKSWSRIANVFLAVYQPGNAANLLAFDYSNQPQQPAPDDGSSELFTTQVATLNPGLTDADAETVLSDSGRQETPVPDSVARSHEKDGQCSRLIGGLRARRCNPILLSRSFDIKADEIRLDDINEAVELAASKKELSKLMDMALPDYRIRVMAEFRKRVKQMPPLPRRWILIRPESPGCNSSPEAGPPPEPPSRERQRHKRILSAFGVES